MPATLQAPAPVSPPSSIPEKTLLLALGITSFAALLLELALTRLFSVVLFYHFAFLAISIALLGLGAGGVFAYLLKPRLARVVTRHLAARLCLASAVAIVIVLAVVLRVPVALSVTDKNFLRLSALYVVSAVPFFLTGFLFSVVFARETWRPQTAVRSAVVEFMEKKVGDETLHGNPVDLAEFFMGMIFARVMARGKFPDSRMFSDSEYALSYIIDVFLNGVRSK